MLGCLLTQALMLPATALAQERTLFRVEAASAADAAGTLTADQRRRLEAVRQDKVQGPAQLVRVDIGALRDGSVIVPLPGAGNMRLQRTNVIERKPGDFTWFGQTQVPGGQTVLVVRDGQITGSIYLGNDQYMLTPIGDGLHALTKIIWSAFPPQHPPGPLPVPPRDPNERRGALPSPQAPDGPIRIDFLGAYTEDTLAANPNIANTIQLSIDMANAAYAASNAGVELTTVGTMLVSGYFEGSKTFQTMLEEVSNGTGAMAAVHERRDLVAADLVGLFVVNYDFCGVAWVYAPAAYAYSVNNHTCVPYHTISHEIGHNFGAWHDLANTPPNPPFAYGHGYIHPQNLWRTIQSYASSCGNCPVIGRFSNPLLTYQGSHTGTVAQHDVARVHRERAATVAAFRQPPATALLTVSPAGNFSASGPPGGPFSPSSQTYMVRNSGGAPMNWSAFSFNPEVVVVTPTSGTLAPDTQVPVTVSIAPDAAALGSGTYAGTVSFTNATNLAGNTQRQASLTVTGTSTSCADNFASATAISGVSGTATGSTANATRETGKTVHHVGAAGVRSVWCKWVAPSTGQATFHTSASNFDTVLAVYTGTSVSTLTQLMSNDDAANSLRSRISFHAIGGTTYYIAVAGRSSAQFGSYALSWSHTSSQGTTGLASAILPYARSVQVGTTATAFASIVNSSGTAATGCYLQMPAGTSKPGAFQYQTANAANQVTGTVNTPTNVAASSSQNFVFGFTPSAAFTATDIRILFDCENRQPATSFVGVNTFLLAASSTPTPDLVAIGTTPSGDGIVRMMGAGGSSFFAAAAVNIGAGGSITATVDDNSNGLPLVRSICQTDPVTGACLSPAAASVTSTVNAGQTVTYSVFVTASGNVTYNPAQNRLFLRLASGGVTRGATHVAVCAGVSCPSSDAMATHAASTGLSAEVAALK